MATSRWTVQVAIEGGPKLVDHHSLSGSTYGAVTETIEAGATATLVLHPATADAVRLLAIASKAPDCRGRSGEP